MELMLLRTFQRQVARQCKYVLFSAEEINKGLKERDPEYVFFAIQNLLTASANIAKALWGGGGKRAAER